MTTIHRPLVVATLGDSLTDEYSSYGPASSLGIPVSSLASSLANSETVGRDSARNWVLNLAATRSSQVTFGDYSVASRGEVRDQGFAEDWARSGATATGSNLDGSGTTFQEEYDGNPGQSLPGLLTQTVADSGYSPKNINIVTILIGANDYAQGMVTYAESLGQDDVFAGKTSKGVNPLNAEIEGSIKAAVTQVRRSIPKAKIVVVTPPDLTISPLVKSALAAGSSLFPDLTRTVSDSVAALDHDLSSLTRQKQVGLVNLQPLFAKFLKSPRIEGVRLNLQATGQDLNDGFIGDGFHPGTIIQGVLAQAIVAKIDNLYGSEVITPLTGADIVNYARATQPSVSLSLVTTSEATGSNGATLQAVVAPGSGGISASSGTVTFESITPATSSSPATFGTILWTAPIDGSGVAILNVAPSALNVGPIYAVYGGDEFNDSRISNPLGATSTGSSPTSTETEIFLSNSTTATKSTTIEADVFSSDGSLSGSPDGTVTLNLKRRSPVALTLVDGRASVTVPSSPLRNQAVQAVYSGSHQFGASRSVQLSINS